MKRLTILIFCFSWLALNATSWRVNNNPAINADYATFEAAVAGASAGDTLYMEGSTFTYGIGVLTKPLVLIGPGYYLTENDSTQATNLEANFVSFTVDSTASGSKIYGCEFDDNVKINGSYVVFARNWVYGPSIYGTGIKLANDNDVINCTIIQNFFSNISSRYNSYDPTPHNTLIANNIIAGAMDFKRGATISIINNVIRGNVDVYNSIIKNNIQHYEGGNGFMENENNIFEYNLTSHSTMPDGIGNQTNIDMNQVFVDFDGSLGYSTDGKWQLKEGSPAIGAGEGGVDCGAFQNPTPYVLSGLPAVPHIFEATVPSAGSNQSGLPVTIKVKAQN
jgi:hypothetical protein